MSKLVRFGKECLAELRKVVWPSKDDVLSSVKIVIISTIIIAAFLGILDTIFVSFMTWFF